MMNNTAHSIRPEPTTGWTPPSSPKRYTENEDDDDIYRSPTDKTNVATTSSHADIQQHFPSVAAPAPKPSLYEELMEYQQEHKNISSGPAAIAAKHEALEETHKNHNDPHQQHEHPGSQESDRKPSARTSSRRSAAAAGTYRQPIPREYFSSKPHQSNHSTTSFASEEDNDDNDDSSNPFEPSRTTVRQSVTTANDDQPPRRRRSSQYQSSSMGAAASLDADVATAMAFKQPREQPQHRNPLESSWHTLSTSTHHLPTTTSHRNEYYDHNNKNNNPARNTNGSRNPLESSWHNLSTSTHHLPKIIHNDSDDMNALLAQRLQQQEANDDAIRRRQQLPQSTHSASSQSSFSAYSSHFDHTTAGPIQSVEDAQDEALALRLQQEEEERAAQQQQHDASYLEEDEALAHQLLQQEEEAMRRRSDPSLLEEDEALARRLQEELSLQEGPSTSASSSHHTNATSSRNNETNNYPMSDSHHSQQNNDDEALARRLQEMEESARPPISTVDDDPLLSQAGDRHEQERILAQIRSENERRQLEWAMSQDHNSGVGLLPNAHVVRLDEHPSGESYAHSPRQQQRHVVPQQSQRSPPVRYADSSSSFTRTNNERAQRNPYGQGLDQEEVVEDIYPSTYRAPPGRSLSMPTSYGLDSESPRHPMAHQPPPMSHQRQEIVMRGQQETVEAIQAGQSHVIQCRGCGVRLQAPVHYSLVYCPTCGFVSPGSG